MAAWRSDVVSGRRPLAQDAMMDFGVMSDLEWEEEPEGEDLSVRRDLYLTLRNDLKQAPLNPHVVRVPESLEQG